MRGIWKKQHTTVGDADRAPSPRTPGEVVDDTVEGRRLPTPDPDKDDDPGLAWERHRPRDEKRFGRIRGFQRQGGSLAPSNRHRGSPASWIAVALAVVGFAVGGFALVQGNSVVLLIVAGVLLLVSFLVAVVFDILTDVVLDPPRMESEEPHHTPLHRIKREPPQQD